LSPTYEDGRQSELPAVEQVQKISKEERVEAEPTDNDDDNKKQALSAWKVEDEEKSDKKADQKSEKATVIVDEKLRPGDVFPAAAFRDVELKTAEIQVEVSESNASVQTDLSFMLAAMMSKKPGSQRAIEDFARQTLEEFGLSQKWGTASLGKPDFQVTKPSLLVTPPIVPDAPPTVLKTKAAGANALSQSTGFALTKSGPYFLRGKGSQRAPSVKGKALYDVVPP
jgi:hypothetical protein